jgi:steroid 5-alpha reductase family enzyme
MSFDGAGFVAVLPWTALIVVLAFGVTFLVARHVGKHAVIDITWGLGFALIGLVAYPLRTGDDGRALLALALVSLWALRLATHLWLRSLGRGEDRRYEAVLSRASGNRDRYALQRVYLPQAAIMWFVSLPLQVVMFTQAPLGWLAWVGVMVFVAGLFFEAVGDWQLQRFRDDGASQGKVLDTGLWRYTRHPNYFGDTVVWWGIFLVCADGGPGWFTILSPLAMTYLLVKRTGKPLLEQDMAERRPAYADYVRRTSGFVPRPPRQHEA